MCRRVTAKQEFMIESASNFITDGTIDVWFVRLDRDIFQRGDNIDVLSDDEIRTASRFVFEQDRRRFVRCRCALRTILAGYTEQDPTEIRFSYNEFGKPFVDRSLFKFNVAHSGEVALIAVTLRSEIGVDVEFVDGEFDSMNIAGSVFSSAEFERFKLITSSAEQSRSFYTGWTRKEAVLKAIGQGFSTPLDQQKAISEIDKNGNAIFTSNIENETVTWSLTSLAAPEDYVAALSAGAAIKNIRYRKISDIYDPIVEAKKYSNIYEVL